MKYIKLFENFESTQTFIIKKGTELFHSTSEEFGTTLQVSPYDKVLWTTLGDSAISQTYIPISGISMHININDLIKPSKDTQITTFQKYLGIDFNDVEIENNRIVSFTDAPIFGDISLLYEEYKEKYNTLYKKVKELRDEFYRLEKLPYSKENDILIDKIQEDWDIAEKELSSLQYVDTDRLRKERVEEILNKAGYTDHDNMKIRFDKGEVMKQDEAMSGYLYIIEPTRDLKIYDYAKGRESDLTDLDYHKTKMFRNIEKDGYDGIRINDFAQSEDEGNFGHISIGLFENTIKDLKIIDKIEAKHNLLGVFRTKGHYDSEEYLKWKNKL
jgi:hypothetical protein